MAGDCKVTFLTDFSSTQSTASLLRTTSLHLTQPCFLSWKREQNATNVCAGTVWFLDISLQTCLPAFYFHCRPVSGHLAPWHDGYLKVLWVETLRKRYGFQVWLVCSPSGRGGALKVHVGAAMHLRLSRTTVSSIHKQLTARDLLTSPSICLWVFSPSDCTWRWQQNFLLAVGGSCIHVMWNPGKSRGFQHAALRDQSPLPSDSCAHRQQRQGGVVAVSVYSYIVCASFISLLTLSSTFMSPNRTWEHNLTAYRRDSLQNSEGKKLREKSYLF